MATLRISLRAGERIFVNGAVVKVDRKTTLEFLNDVTFLLESHVLQPEQATTPIRQLYFIVQMILMTPSDADQARAMFSESHERMMKAYETAEILDGLDEVGGLVAKNRCFEALKRLRALMPLEDEILGHDAKAETTRLPLQNETRLAAGGMR